MGWIATMRDALRDARRFYAIAGASAATSTGLAQSQLELEIDRWRREYLLADPRCQDARCLNRFEHKVYSQDGSDGILREILHRVGDEGRYFVEFGVGNGLENNTAFLVAQGWAGLWIDGNSEQISSIGETLAGPISSGRLRAIQAFITKENIEDLFARGDVPPEPTVMSIDIDGNDYWVWEAINRYRPRVLVMEYNSTFPADCSWVMDYDPEHVWREDMHFGASLQSLVDLCEAKGYVLVGCSLAGVNCYFVRKELVSAEDFAGPFTAAHLYQPARYWLVREAAGHRRAFGSRAR